MGPSGAFHWSGDARTMRRLHGWLTVGWAAASVPLALLWGTSVLFVSWLSLYAIVTGHWSSWQASRVETHQDQDADVREVLNEVRRLREDRDNEGVHEMPRGQASGPVLPPGAGEGRASS